MNEKQNNLSFLHLLKKLFDETGMIPKPLIRGKKIAPPAIILEFDRDYRWEDDTKTDLEIFDEIVREFNLEKFVKIEKNRDPSEMFVTKSFEFVLSNRIIEGSVLVLNPYYKKEEDRMMILKLRPDQIKLKRLKVIGA